jgi:photosystem II stability/assembly factor-like uncharacterized protein
MAGIQNALMQQRKTHGRLARTALPLALLACLMTAACGTAAQGARQHPTGTATPTTPATRTPNPFPKQWQVAQGAPQHVSIDPYGSGLAFAPSAPRTGYLCTSGAGGDPGLYKSADGGQTWAPVTGAPAQQQGLCLVSVDPANANDVVVVRDRLWRSQDGGATWQQLTPITVSGWSISVINLAVVGSRLVAAVAINGAGTLDNALYASDDGGASWQQLGASLPARVVGFAALGTTLIAESDPPYVGNVAPPVTAAWAAARHAEPLALPAPSSGPPPIFSRSPDGGRTWTTVSVPGTLPAFAQVATGSTQYAVTVSVPTTSSPAAASWSRDGGATWTRLPAFASVAGGYPAIGSYAGRAIGPDGTALVDTSYDPGGPASGTRVGGIFCVRPGDASPTWRPLAPGGPMNLQVVPTATGERVWAIQADPTAQIAGTLVYFDLP